MSLSSPKGFMDVFHGQAGAGGVMSFEQFMRLALYHPDFGYYCRDKARVGYGAGSDFFTSSTSGPVFGELVCAACVSLLAEKKALPKDFRFIEIGAESSEGILAGVDHPFAEVRVLKLGDPLSLSGACVVFSNELFDAQPCRQFVRRGSEWRELGVGEKEGSLIETELGPASEPWLPDAAPEGYRFDAPRAAAGLAETLAKQPWTGLFVAMDYGKSFMELAEACPQGTLRAYHRHTQSNELLSRPGEQDLTCHVCWDWIRIALESHGFPIARLETQEMFFVMHAGQYIARAIAEDAAHASRRKLSLMQLLHPAHLGQKFQAMHAYRE